MDPGPQTGVTGAGCKILHREFLGNQIRYLVRAAGAEIVVDQSHGRTQSFILRPRSQGYNCSIFDKTLMEVCPNAARVVIDAITAD